MCRAFSGLPISWATLAASSVSAWIALALDGFEGLLPRLGGVVQNERHAGAAGGLAIQRRGVKPQEARAGIVDLELVPHDALAARAVEPGDLLPIQLGDEIGDGLAFDVRAASPGAG